MRVAAGLGSPEVYDAGMLIFAAAAHAHATVADRLRQIPMEFWWKMGLGIAVIFAAVIVIRKVAHVNKIVLGIGVFVVTTMVGFNWIYERNEPTWASPAVEFLSGFFPSKAKLASR